MEVRGYGVIETYAVRYFRKVSIENIRNTDWIGNEFFIVAKHDIAALVHTLTTFKPCGTAFDSIYRSDMNGSSWKFVIDRYWMTFGILRGTCNLVITLMKLWK